MVLGLMLTRFNVGLIAWQRPAESAYFPHWMELAVSFGVIAAGVLAYDWVARLESRRPSRRSSSPAAHATP